MDHFKNSILSILLLFFAACSADFQSQQIAQTATGSGPCPAFETFLHDQLQESLTVTETLPRSQDILKAFSNHLSKEFVELNEGQIESLTTKFVELYDYLKRESSSASVDERSILLTKLEMGTYPSDITQAAYSSKLQAYSNEATEALSECTPPETNPIGEETDTSFSANNHGHKYGEGEYFQAIEDATSLPLFGTLKTFATAYQSCEAISLWALNSDSAPMEGIKVVGTHSSGRGKLREIASLPQVQASHPYIQHEIPEAESCFNVQAKPLIYDFGGKPYTTTSATSSLNFFKNHGTGSSELGTDCSGFVYSALMTAGLKLSPSKPPRARGVLAFNANAFRTMGSNMACFDRVSAGINNTLKAGDILASKGHIFIVDWVGADPFGITNKKNASECFDITHRDFDFTLMQSSPSKGAIGINRMVASDYLANSSSMRQALEEFAQLHCVNTLNEEISMPIIDKATLMRHSERDECVSDARIKLERESCLYSCTF